MGITFCSICFNPNTANVLASTIATLGLLGIPCSVISLSDFEQVEEACHREYLAYLVIYIDDDNLTTLSGSFLTDSEEQAQAGTTDVFKGCAVENNLLVGILQ